MYLKMFSPRQIPQNYHYGASADFTELTYFQHVPEVSRTFKFTRVYDENIDPEYVDVSYVNNFTLFSGCENPQRFTFFLFTVNRFIQDLNALDTSNSNPYDYEPLVPLLNGNYVVNVQTCQQILHPVPEINQNNQICVRIEHKQTLQSTTFYFAPLFNLKSRPFFFLFSKPVTQQEFRFHFKSHPILKSQQIQKFQFISFLAQIENEVEFLKTTEQFKNGVKNLTEPELRPIYKSSPTYSYGQLETQFREVEGETLKWKTAYENERIRAQEVEKELRTQITRLTEENFNMRKQMQFQIHSENIQIKPELRYVDEFESTLRQSDLQDKLKAMKSQQSGLFSRMASQTSVPVGQTLKQENRRRRAEDE
ncbi:Hypothetical_protein [Hexamita inflata]|uniref:Hypothetical_protein n=1 Tax=Hexamita inflata TaxID=28002 RepID=A0AA86R304_9EUKA|nr:Hypothetical protein HINF_LOCUS57155 [Hexamita inflata]